MFPDGEIHMNTFIHSPVNPLLVDIASYNQSLSSRLCLVIFYFPLLTFSILILLFTLINDINHVTHILRPNLPLNTFLQESFVLLQWNESSILELDAAEFLLTPFPKNKSHFVFERFNLFNLHPQGNPIKNQSRMTVTTAVTRK